MEKEISPIARRWAGWRSFILSCETVTIRWNNWKYWLLTRNLLVRSYSFFEDLCHMMFGKIEWNSIKAGEFIYDKVSHGLIRWNIESNVWGKLLGREFCFNLLFFHRPFCIERYDCAKGTRNIRIIKISEANYWYSLRKWASKLSRIFV